MLNTVSRLSREYSFDTEDEHWSPLRKLVPLTRKLVKASHSRVVSATLESLLQVDEGESKGKGRSKGGPLRPIYQSDGTPVSGVFVKEQPRRPTRQGDGITAPLNKRGNISKSTDFESHPKTSDCQVNLMRVIITIIVGVLVLALLIPVVGFLLSISVNIDPNRQTWPIIEIILSVFVIQSVLKNLCVWEAINRWRNR